MFSTKVSKTSSAYEVPKKGGPQKANWIRRVEWGRLGSNGVEWGLNRGGGVPLRVRYRPGICLKIAVIAVIGKSRQRNTKRAGPGCCFLDHGDPLSRSCSFPVHSLLRPCSFPVPNGVHPTQKAHGIRVLSDFEDQNGDISPVIFPVSRNLDQTRWLHTSSCTASSGTKETMHFEQEVTKVAW